MNLDWSNWIRGLLAALIGGGSSAVSGGIVVSAYDPKDFNFGDAKIFKVMGFMFVFNAVLSMFMYLKQHPLPDVVTTVTTTEVSTSSGRPPVTITKTVEEKTTGPAEPPKDK